ncbi:MAG: SRPBCC family protein [Deltaproteobacteria bacterium]
MKIYKLKREQVIPITINEAWDFFSNPGNLRLITPPWLGFAIKSELPEKIYPGMIVTYTVTPFMNIPVNWVTEITHMERPNLFVDEQRFGPYRMWHHEHLFRETSGGVEVRDLIHYALPLGSLGRIAHELFIKRQLNEIFEFRKQYLKKKFC